MKASSNLLKPLSVTGLSLAFALGCALNLQGQDTSRNTGGSFNAQPTTAPPITGMTNLNHQTTAAASSSQEALLAARRALATGDVATARSMVESARHFPIDNTLNSDTPAKVEAMIARHGELVNQMQTGGNDHAYNLGAANFLLEQADRLLDYRDFETTNSLLSIARGFNVQYKPGDLTPDRVSMRLQQMQVSAAATSQPRNVSATKLEADRLLSQAQFAYDKGQLELAGQLITQVKSLNLKDDIFEDNSILPWELELKIRKARNKQQDIAAAAFDTPSQGASTQGGGGMVRQADYYPELDTTRNVAVSGTEGPENFRVNDARGKRLYDSGMSALSHDDRKGALEYFRMAWEYRDQLDQTTRQDLESKLSIMQAKAAPASFVQEAVTPAPNTDDLRRQMFSDVLRQRAVADRMVEQRNPRGALNHMRLVRDDVQNSELDEAGKAQLIAVVEREISEMERFIEQNLSEIEVEETNRANMDAVESSRQNRDDIERKIQSLVNDYNQLRHEERFAEAEVVARQAYELDPENLAVVTMLEKIQLQKNFMRYEANEDAKARGFVDTFEQGQRAQIANVQPDAPIEFDGDTWERIKQNRDTNVGQGGYKTERERVIWSALKEQSIQADFNRTPLSEVITILSERSGVNMILDTQAMELENVSIDKPITMNFANPISVESALNVVLNNNNLVFKVDNEVVTITNKQALQANPVPATLYVGDLVVPVPDFSGNAINMQFLGPQQQSNPWVQGQMNDGFAKNRGGVSPVSYNQQMPDSFGFGGNGGMAPSWSGAAAPHTSTPKYNSWGPKGVGGGITEADFEELMDLIQETIDPDSWEANGGSGRIQPFPATLSLIVTQTQENQDRIQNLLTQLRELNDVQIVVEVRFITLRDDFFERIGIDFDFQINDNSGLTALGDTTGGRGGSTIIGRVPVDGAFLPTTDLDIPITQSSFGATAVSLGGGGVDSALNLGFAILSDIEVFFILQAAKGDERSNVTQAPTVTMFNGQSASVFSGTTQPFVTSIQPVVGDFAAAQQPIITILPEGTQLNVRAVASADRRFVKMTLVPFFSSIEDVKEFTFDGSRTVRTGGGTDLEDILNAIAGRDVDSNNDTEITESGTTVQLPVFANTTVTTTVSVPDGGTVLLGGIKRMSEIRTERGVPFLSNIPYVNRLFKNVGIGRETNSLMMMVTPRIIIQEEEEARQVDSRN